MVRGWLTTTPKNSKFSEPESKKKPLKFRLKRDDNYFFGTLSHLLHIAVRRTRGPELPIFNFRRQQRNSNPAISTWFWRFTVINAIIVTITGECNAKWPKISNGYRFNTCLKQKYNDINNLLAFRWVRQCQNITPGVVSLHPFRTPTRLRRNRATYEHLGFFFPF